MYTVARANIPRRDEPQFINAELPQTTQTTKRPSWSVEGAIARAQIMAHGASIAGTALAGCSPKIADWNAYCANGADLQYGRNKEVLFPIDTPPYYAASYEPQLGETMVTCGGIITDGEQNALDKNFEPIPGLYVAGNDCGRRFGYEYITPIPGVSLGLAITLGRECGKSVGKFLSA